jgi:small subunit ribosomal protein S4e
MSKKHLKRLNTPKTWNILRKGTKYIKRPNPGAHKFNYGMALTVFLRDVLKIVKTNKETKNILHNHEILIDCIKRNEVKLIVGFMDTISFPLTKEYYRIVFNNQGKLNYVKIDEKESKLKICKVIGKTMYKNKLQINLSDGKNILIDKAECKTGDSVLIELPKQVIKETLKLKNSSTAMLTGGKHTGSVVTIQEINDKIMKCKINDTVFETSTKYAYVIGNNKSMLKVE